METIRGDVLTRKELEQRGIKVLTTERGGFQMVAPTYDDVIAYILKEKGFLEDKHLNAASDYLELKNSVYGFLNARTIAMILETGGVSTKRSHAECAYYAAARYLGKVTERIVARAMTEAPRQHELESIAAVESYRQSFNQIIDAMELAISAVKKEIEKEVEA